MDHYDHMKTVRAVQDFVIDDLSNWYIRRARRRFYGNEMTEDKKAVYATTYEVLEGLTRMIAPIAPFLSDEMYKKLVDPEKSVHTAFFPEADESLIDEHVEERMDLVKQIATLGRGIREEEGIKVRQPLSEILVDGKYKALISDLTPLIMEELNVKNVVFAEDLTTYMNYVLKPNFRAAGPVLGKKIKAFGKALAAEDPMTFLNGLERNGSAKLVLEGEETEITKELVDVQIDAKEGFSVAMEGGVFAILDTEITPELEVEGLARELVSKVQQMRKSNDYEMMDHIRIFLDADPAVLHAVEEYRDYIQTETLADAVEEQKDAGEKVSLNGHETGLMIQRV